MSNLSQPNTTPSRYQPYPQPQLYPQSQPYQQPQYRPISNTTQQTQPQIQTTPNQYQTYTNTNIRNIPNY